LKTKKNLKNPESPPSPPQPPPPPPLPPAPHLSSTSLTTPNLTPLPNPTVLASPHNQKPTKKIETFLQKNPQNNLALYGGGGEIASA